MLLAISGRPGIGAVGDESHKIRWLRVSGPAAPPGFGIISGGMLLDPSYDGT
jgi:hypothetical protein